MTYISFDFVKFDGEVVRVVDTVTAPSEVIATRNGEDTTYVMLIPPLKDTPSFWIWNCIAVRITRCQDVEKSNVLYCPRLPG